MLDVDAAGSSYALLLNAVVLVVNVGFIVINALLWSWHRTKCYDRSATILAEELGPAHVQFVLERELARVYEHYTADKRRSAGREVRAKESGEDRDADSTEEDADSDTEGDASVTEEDTGENTESDTDSDNGSENASTESEGSDESGTDDSESSSEGDTPPRRRRPATRKSKRPPARDKQVGVREPPTYADGLVEAKSAQSKEAGGGEKTADGSAHCAAVGGPEGPSLAK